MPDGPYATPDEERLLRMINAAGSPEVAGLSLLARLEALETAVAEMEARAAAEPEAELEAAPDAEAASQDPTE